MGRNPNNLMFGVIVGIFDFSDRFIMLMEPKRSGIMQLFLIFVDSRPKIRVFCIFQVGDHIPGA